MKNRIKDQMNYFLIRRLSRLKHIMQFNLDYLNIYLRYIIKKIMGRHRKLNYPTTLQFPITNKCNLNCIMCNIHANEKKEIPIEQLGDILSNKVFKKVQSVGINGGEPFMLKNLDEYIDIVIRSLPQLKNIYIISNGTYTQNTISMLKNIMLLCNTKNIYLTLSFSIDGYSKIHDKIRGVTGTFEKLMCTVAEITKNKNLYCHHLNFICTITSQNVYELDLLESFVKRNNLSINYNIATAHERLKNDIKYDYYSLFNDEHACMVAAEFLYKKFQETNNIKYFSLFKYLSDSSHKRIDNCSNLKDAITLTANGDICYCATHSKVLGNVLKDNIDIYKTYFQNEEYNNEIKKKYCSHCSHYIYGVNAQNYRSLIKEKLRVYHKVKL